MQFCNFFLAKDGKLIVHEVNAGLKRRIILKALQAGPIVLYLTILIIESFINLGSAHLQFFYIFPDRLLFITNAVFCCSNNC